MSEAFVGELRCFGFSFAPVDWAQCNGQLISISQNATLFDLIGTTYGGDGINTYALPDLRSRVPVHFGTQTGATYTMGEYNGVETVTITAQTMPAHTHLVGATTNTATLKRPVNGTFYAQSSGGNTYYAAPGSPTALTAATIGNSGGGGSHSNIQPYLTLNWCISLYGVFPTQN
jgi:microcystin-dependent protein